MQHRTRMIILVVVVLILGLPFMVFAENQTIAVYDFEGTGPDGYWIRPNQSSITRDPSKVISGKASLEIDTMESSDTENDIFVTLRDSAMFQGGKRYSVSFEYKVLDVTLPDSCFYLVAKSKMLKRSREKQTTISSVSRESESSCTHILFNAGRIRL